MNKVEVRKWIPEILAAGKSVWINSTGYSMYPTLKPSDKLKVEPIGFSFIKVGDIIAFEHNGVFIAHRVVEIQRNENTFIPIAKGDSVFKVIEVITEDNYLGKITARNRNGKDQFIFPRHKIGSWYTFYCWSRKKLNGYLQVLTNNSFPCLF